MNYLEYYTPPNPDAIDRVEAFFGNPAEVDVFVAGVYRQARGRIIRPPAQVRPADKFCRQVNRVAAEKLGGLRIPATYTEYKEPKITLHAYADVAGATPTVFDLQYQQFVPPHEREGLPDYMVIPYTTDASLVAGLRRHRDDPDFHHYWFPTFA